jgi:hypothetical protein
MSVLTLDEAKDHLRITSTEEDDKLQGFIDAAEFALRRRVGPLAPTTITFRTRGQATTLRVPTTPAISLTSVTPVGGTALPLTYLWISPGGVIEPTYSGYFPFYWPFYDIVYVAGRATPLDDDLLHLIKDTTKHLWETQRKSVPGQAALAGAAFAFTYRVRELWEPHVQYGFG